MFRPLFATFAAVGALLGAPAAQAGTHWSVGVGINVPVYGGYYDGGYYAPGSVYYPSAPVYYGPAPVVRYAPVPVYGPPPVVYYGPQVVYGAPYGYAYPGYVWNGRFWVRPGHRHWRR